MYSRDKKTIDIINEKLCPHCRKILPLSAFGKSSDRRLGVQVYCKQCRGRTASSNQEYLNSYHKKYRRKKKYKDWYREWKMKNADHIFHQKISYKQALRLAAFDAYGGPSCSCCKEKQLQFLIIDHIDGGGTKHRKSMKSGSAIYTWLKKNGYPSGFRVLCHNCNWGIYVNGGVCPHNDTICTAERKVG